MVDGLCEVTAGSNLFYVDRTGRYLVIGRVYDMESPCFEAHDGTRYRGSAFPRGSGSPFVSPTSR